MKTRLKPVELFLALGLVATVSACGGQAPTGGTDDEQTPATEVSPDDDGDDAEGDEEGEGDD